MQVACSYSLSAQNTLSDMNKLLKQSLHLTDGGASYAGSDADSCDITWLFQTDTANSIASSLSVQKWHKRFFQSDYGIRLIASANRHFGEGFGGEIEDFDQYRISLGVEWDLYHQGWFKKHTQSKISNNEIELLQLYGEEEALNRTYGAQYNAIIYLFNKEKIAYLTKYREALKQGLSFYQKNYLKHLIPYHEVLELKKRIDKFDLIIGDYKAFNDAFEATFGLHWKPRSSTQLHPMQVAIDQLLDSEDLLERRIAIRDLENDNIHLRNRIKPDLRVGVYARTNYTNGQIGGINGHYNTIGLRMSIPLRSLYNRTKQLTDLEVRENNQRHEMAYKERKKELMVTFYEYEYSLQQYTKLHFDHLKLKEKIRQQSVLTTLDTTQTSVIRQFTLFQEYMDLGYEKIELRQVLYLGLLRLQKKLPLKNVASFCQPVQYKSDQKLKGRRIFQITKKDIEEFGIHFVLAYLTNNEVMQIRALDLSEEQLSLLREKGIEAIQSFPEEALRIPVKDFTDRIALEAYIEQKVDSNSSIVFDSFKDMINLETIALQNN